MDLKQARETMGVTIKEMVNLMGVDRGTYNKWERQENAISAAPRRLVNSLLWIHKMGLMDAYREVLPKKGVSRAPKSK